MSAYICKYCETVSLSKKSVLAHIRASHENKCLAFKQATLIDGKPFEIDNNNKSYNASFAIKVGFRTEDFKMDTRPVAIEEEKVTNETKEVCKTGNLSEKVDCSKPLVDKCGSKDSMKSEVYVPKTKRVDGSLIYICSHPECKYESNRLCHVKEHFADKHTTERRFKCNYCNCSLATNRYRDLRKHIENMHTVMRDKVWFGKFSCPFLNCPFATNKLSHLKRHVKTNRHKRDPLKTECSVRCEKLKFKR